MRAYFSILGGALYWIFFGSLRRKPVKIPLVLRQIVLIGVQSVPMVALLSFFMGLVLAMQSAYTLKNLGAEVYVANLIAVSFFREIGPFLAAIVLAGRCGSAMTAEIATMRVSEEIEALEVMAINPVRYLVSPRLLAAVCMMPSLCLIAEFAGNLGGWAIGVGSLGVSSDVYIARSLDALVLKDVWSGLVKGVVFSTLVSSLACYWGMTVSGGAEGVGQATTRSVVTSLVAILSADVMLTAIFYFL